MIAFLGSFAWDEKIPITTIHKGNIAPMIEPSPAEMY
jgi:hypothetical protein